MEAAEIIGLIIGSLVTAFFGIFAWLLMRYVRANDDRMKAQESAHSQHLVKYDEDRQSQHKTNQKLTLIVETLGNQVKHNKDWADRDAQELRERVIHLENHKS